MTLKEWEELPELHTMMLYTRKQLADIRGACILRSDKNLKELLIVGFLEQIFTLFEQGSLQEWDQLRVTMSLIQNEEDKTT